MKAINSHKILNVRMSQTTFDYMKTKSHFVENEKGVCEGRVLVCMQDTVKNMVDATDKDTYMNTGRTVNQVDIRTRALLERKSELLELWAKMKRDGAQFAYIMSE